jgi:hypothetical protein
MENKSEQDDLRKQIDKEGSHKENQRDELSLDDQIQFFAEIIIDQLLKEINDEKESN